jgi:ATP-dependent Lon protease
MSQENISLVRLTDEPPSELPTILLDDLVPFPGPVAPLIIDRPERREAILAAKNNNSYVLLLNRKSLTQSKPEEVAEPIPPNMVAEIEAAINRVIFNTAEDAFEQLAGKKPVASPVPAVKLEEVTSIGVLARLVKVIRLPDGRLMGLLQLVRRAQVIDVLKTEAFPTLKVMYPAEVVANEEQGQALFRQLRVALQQFFELHPHMPDEMKAAAFSIEIPAVLADFIAQHLSRNFEERLAFLQELDVNKRIQRALEITLREADLLSIGNRISKEIRDRVEKNQRDYFLREQLKSIRTELGEEKDATTLAVGELTAKLEKAGLSEAAKARVADEMKRLKMLPPETAEHNVIRSYLELIASLPWSKVSEDSRDIVKAREILDADHHGLKEVKDRVVEFLAVHQLNPNKVGSILCFAGPPGVGKTSLGQSIARALGREFYRFSVGGMRDEAEIKGHRRTYVGAMPGRILQALRTVKTANPVIMLDELDKMGHDWRGDPAAALLEVLDPAQNKSFADHYLDLPFDLSRVMFIATANVQSDIPFALHDRLEIIDLPGYIPEEKVDIAVQHLYPRQLAEHGLNSKLLQLTRSAIRKIVREYTHEAGVRELNRLLGKICRKRAVQVIGGDTKVTLVGEEKIPAFLGPTKIHDDRITKRPVPGVAVGLAWTSVGGDILFIELVTMPGKGNVKVTGHLGEVMSESAQLAMSFVKSRAADFGIDPAVFKQFDFHLHFPAGAVKKDGPSAGVTITTALVSLLTKRSIPPKLAMTGEMTLRGEVLPVGGIREKVVAARRAGVQTVILPKRNKGDIEEIPPEVKESIQFVFASVYDDVFKTVFGKPQGVVQKLPVTRRLKTAEKSA